MSKLPPPQPNSEIPSKFVLECLDTESEGDGMLYGALLKDKVLYAKSSGRWYIWNEHSWHVDKVGMSIGLVKYVCDRYGDEIQAFEDKIDQSKRENDSEDHKMFKKSWDRKIELLQRKIKALRQTRGRNACLEFASTNLANPITIVGDEFDQDPWLLGVSNGVVDLRSGELYKGEPGQFISKHCSCDYLGIDDVDISDWEKFLNDVHKGDKEIIEFLQRLFGYGLTGLSTQHVFPFLLGRGRNGKSLFIESIIRVMGEYAAVVPTELFMQTNSPRSASQADPAIMKFEGLRLAVSDEVEEGSKLSGQSVKKITGGGTLEGRSPYDKEVRNFTPSHLMVMIGNHEPTPPSGDPAFWDRTYLIKHKVRFVKTEPKAENEQPADPDIEDKLLQMDSQILTWLVIGCLQWQANNKKLDPPQSVMKATEEYQEDADFIHQFIEACCSTSNTEIKTGSTELYTAFVVWFRENINSKKNYTPSQRAFGLKLKARDQFKPSKINGVTKYKGIALNPDWYQRMLRVAKGQDDLSGGAM